jgi:hypothetical protein
MLPLRLYIPSYRKTLGQRAKIPEEFRSSAATKNPNLGDISLCSGTLPGRRISLGDISIDSTAIFVAIADSHDEE